MKMKNDTYSHRNIDNNNIFKQKKRSNLFKI